MISQFDIKLSRCRSKRIIDDPEEVFNLVRGGATRANPNRGVLTFNKDEGTIMCRKPSTCGVTRQFEEPSEAKLRRLVTARGMEFNEEFVGRGIFYFMSDERVDNEGDIIRQNWDFADFSKNSPMPFSHEWFNPPVGRVIDWGITNRDTDGDDFKGKALWGLGLFASDERSDSVFRLVKSGFLPSGSVGFISQRVIDVRDEDERAELGLGPWGLIFDKNALLEFSPTTIPANPGAHIAASMNKLRSHDVDVLREMKRQELADLPTDQQEEWKTWDTWITEAASTIFGKTYSLPSLKAPIKATMDDNDPETPPGDTAPSLTEIRDLVQEQGELVAALVEGFNTLVTEVKVGVADMQASLDKLGSLKSSDPNDPPNDDLPPEEGKSLRGSLLGAVTQNLDGLKKLVGSTDS